MERVDRMSLFLIGLLEGSEHEAAQSPIPLEFETDSCIIVWSTLTA